MVITIPGSSFTCFGGGGGGIPGGVGDEEPDDEEPDEDGVYLGAHVFNFSSMAARRTLDT
jgi:hypothetical protein